MAYGCLQRDRANRNPWHRRKPEDRRLFRFPRNQQDLQGRSGRLGIAVCGVVFTTVRQKRATQHQAKRLANVGQAVEASHRRGCHLELQRTTARRILFRRGRGVRSCVGRKSKRQRQRVSIPKERGEGLSPAVTDGGIQHEPTQGRELRRDACRR